MEWFSPDILLAALKRDPLIEASIASVKSLSDLPAALPEEGVSVPHQTCQFTLSPDFLTRFRIVRMLGSQVAVRIQMSPIGGACHAATAEIGILLPARKTIKLELGPTQSEIPKLAQPVQSVVTKLDFNVPACRRLPPP